MSSNFRERFVSNMKSKSFLFSTFFLLIAVFGSVFLLNACANKERQETSIKEDLDKEDLDKEDIDKEDLEESVKEKDNGKEDTNENNASNEEFNQIIYENKEYGFRFRLPKSWKDYTIVTDKWEGLPIGDTQSEEEAESGPIVSIRHPQWTEKEVRQDIPIMIFTLEQWDALQNEQFHIGAAPMNPSELGRNTRYVFALPARYNYAFPTGYEEVEDILEDKPLS